MANEIFVDTSGFYALLIKADDLHAAAVRILREARRRKRRFVTSDYVLDETATLLKARGHAHLLSAFFGSLLTSHACRTEWTDAERFHTCRAFFLKHVDQEWSFTDCLSFCIMKELRLSDALTKDGHFGAAGFVALLKQLS
jgi:predicted nucleic acid-binding protein